ncbi:hypothetical protein [Kitasatospora griseola]|uniref:hypothetical protein n=1 Tax=Kitasatospora griseola TaxID=2064 RepID=UPI001670339E|nr:hypothetical protein [Kitasatospora griseola]GGQ93712.1 hypothetical protein GCM10010195_57100 [Kitasatospora griseola]
MGRTWNIDLSAPFAERLGKSAAELGLSDGRDECPDIWRLANGDIAVIGTDATEAYRDRLPEGVRIGEGERLVVIPGAMLAAAKPDIPDA